LGHILAFSDIWGLLTFSVLHAGRGGEPRFDISFLKVGMAGIGEQEFVGPDSVDELISVTSTAGWLQLSAIAAIVLGLIVWSAVTDIPIKVKTRGMILGSEGVAEVTMASRGRLTELEVKPGDTVKKGDLIALVAQPELESQIAIRQTQLAGAQAREDSLLQFARRSAQAQNGAAMNRIKSAEERIGLLTGREKLLAEHDTALHGLAQKGFIGRDAVLKSEADLGAVREQLAGARSEIAAAQSDLKLQDVQRDKELTDIRQEIVRVTAEIEKQQKLLEANQEVRSPYSGQVIEVKHSAGEFVEPGAAILSLIQTATSGDPHAHLIATTFAPPENGKEIQIGMPVNVAPAGVRSNEYGYIRGKVSAISDAPATSAGMMRVLKNDTLVRQLTQNGAPFQVEIEMDPANTPSGFAWTSSSGPKRVIKSGTPADADIVVKQSRLLGVILPPLARFFTD
jgi:HlyD family secretion protein